MPAIHKLLESSIVALVRYHEKKLAAASSKEHDTVRCLLAQPQDEMMRALDAIITEAATRDRSQQPLMQVILEHIRLLHTFVHSTEPYSVDALALLKQQWVKLVAGLNLLSKSPSTVSLGIGAHKISGLSISSWGGWVTTLNDLGSTLKDTLLDKFPREAIEEIFELHQQRLELNMEAATLAARFSQVEIREQALKAREAVLEKDEAAVAREKADWLPPHPPTAATGVKRAASAPTVPVYSIFSPPALPAGTSRHEGIAPVSSIGMGGR